MSEFLRTLRSFDTGSLSRDELLAEVDRQLAENVTDPVTMLAWLDEAHEYSGLPYEVREQISEKIHGCLGVTAANKSYAASSDATEFFTDGERPAPPVVMPLSARPRSFTLAERKVLKQRFQLLELLGEGGMGRIYKAIDLRRIEGGSDDVFVAVKLLTTSFHNYPRSLALLQREAMKLQRLWHPNIVRVLDCDRDGELVFMTMEYLAGRSLQQKLGSMAASKLKFEESMHILSGIAAALSCAHRNGIVHGDLKPGNVIVTDAGEVKVIDFGVAGAMRRAGGNTAPPEDGETPRLSGVTPSYASPEMLERAPSDPRDDVYALSCMAYEMLTGVHPFDRRPATDARDAGMKPVFRSPLSRAQFRALIDGLQFDRAKRTLSVEQFMQDLRAERTHGWRAGALTVLAALAALIAGYWIYRSQMDEGVTPNAPGTSFRDCESCPTMKVLAPGRFAQGSETAAVEGPQHTVVLARPFALGVQEVTRGQFAEFVDATGREMNDCASYDGAWVSRAELNWSNVGFPQSAAHPVVCVSWEDANAYAAWLSRKTGQRYRLPSASEWEYAARAGSAAEQPWADNIAGACAAANVADATAAQRYSGWDAYACSDGFIYTAPVGTFAPNAFGLNDMLGNVFEWVQDCWHDNYENAPTDGSAWVQSECGERELRGGSWFTSPQYVRAAYRNRFEAGYRSNSVGFRVARDLPK